MNNLIQQIQAQHDADETWYAYRDDAWPSGYPRPAQHKDRGDLLAVIKSIVDLCDESVLKGNVMEFADSRKAVRTDAIKALLNGDAP